eukprot:254387_1
MLPVRILCRRSLLYRSYTFNNKRSLSTSTVSKTALVSGGNRGIGFQLCKQLAQNGINVIMATRKLENGTVALEKLFNNYGQRWDNIDLLQLDLTDTSSISDAVKHVEYNYDSIDILVNNAGINIRTYLSSTTMINEVLSTNYYGTVEFTKAMLPLMTTHKTIKSPLSSIYPSRIIIVSDRNAALNKMHLSFQEAFLSEHLDESALNGLMELYKMDALKYMDQKDDDDELVIMKEGWLKCPYLMAYVGLNQFCRILGETFNAQNEHFIAAYCPGHCVTDSRNYLRVRDAADGAYGIYTLATMLIDKSVVPNGSFFSAFYKDNTLDSIELEVMDWKNPSETTQSWDSLCFANFNPHPDGMRISKHNKPDDTLETIS